MYWFNHKSIFNDPFINKGNKIDNYYTGVRNQPGPFFAKHHVRPTTLNATTVEICCFTSMQSLHKGLV